MIPVLQTMNAPGYDIAGTSAILKVTNVTISSSTVGTFTLAHGLPKIPISVNIQMTSGGLIWFQSGTLFDATNLYLVASDSGLSATLACFTY
jgi:hypothetical protein